VGLADSRLYQEWLTGSLEAYPGLQAGVSLTLAAGLVER